jgi:hypothetical protein
MNLNIPPVLLVTCERFLLCNSGFLCMFWQTPQERGLSYLGCTFSWESYLKDETNKINDSLNKPNPPSLLCNTVVIRRLRIMQQFGKDCIRVRSRIIHFDAYPPWIAISDFKTWLTLIWRAEVFWSTVCMNLIVVN